MASSKRIDVIKYVLHCLWFSISLCSLAHDGSVIPVSEQFTCTQQLITTETVLPIINVENSNQFKLVTNKKEWTIITYMAADNDLSPFARKNLKQQMDIGSGQRFNIVTQLDTKVGGNKKISKRYYVEKDKLILFQENEIKPLDSGIPQTLIDCCKWAIKNFPAHHYILVLWNHGTGILDIGARRCFNPAPLFIYNQDSHLIELDRSIPFITYLETLNNSNDRGICFDDSTGHYLSNQDLDMALETICTQHLQGKKFTMICFDACLMSMLEIANIVKKYAHIMISSQEVELGTGYAYDKVLSPLLHTSLQPEDFAKHIVVAFQETYNKITNDFTQSALNLQHIDELEHYINEIARLLIQCLQAQKGTVVIDALRSSRHKLFCTHFDEPSYIDLHHFLTNVQSNIKKFVFKGPEYHELNNKLYTLIAHALNIIQKTVIAQCVGQNLARARGISIYFPERRIHPSYMRTKFAQTNTWITFLQSFVGVKRA